MKTAPLTFALILVIILSACQVSPQSNQPSSPSRSGEDFQWIFNATPDPVNLTVALDTARQVEARIPIQGGSLSATGADGTRYTLDIPADALLNDALIKMTPVQNLSGLPFGSGPALAVQLEPEGLFFNNFVTLTITPPEAIPVDQQIMYGYQASGQELTLAFPQIDSPEIKLRLLHFSGYGVTKGLLSDIEPVRQRLGGSAEARLQSEAARMLNRARQDQLLGGDDSVGDLNDFFASLFEQFEREVVQPRVAAAGESCAAGRLALQTVLSFERQKQLLGMGTEDAMSGVLGLMETVGKVCLQEEYELCVEQHIIHRMIPVWLGLERQAQLLGAGESSLGNEGRKLIEQCLRFDLEFYSSAGLDDGSGDGYTTIVRSKTPLRFNTAEMKFSGQAPLVNEKFDFWAKSCKTTSTRGGSTFQVADMTYITDTHTPTDELGYVRDLELSYFPERTTEVFSVKCPDQPTYTSPPSGLWWGIFLTQHFSEMAGMENSLPQDPAEVPGMPGMGDLGGMDSGFVPGLGMFPMPASGGVTGFIARDWEIIGGEYYAKKEWIKEDAGFGLVEAGTLKLYHRPG